jgi:predicted MFS family arabinose efflux permease
LAAVHHADVAVIQLAVALGATVGALMFAAAGYQSTFGASALLLLIGALPAFLTS